ncbi:hypothetical protein [Acinetobacter pollinis]|uniref:hypothetical protein n=1 Tax=Acinetobacter pollinis TaxID=2605270 RepID=UPI0018A32E57|nr:hypothetical protein [Acinetobacter pollinis]MBF7689847.1 hypothetical protein [Acinetobacter pollinis]MBF7697301.1 hypothetical protein [Acinetobacter pollinis]
MKIKHIAVSLLAITSTQIFADECLYPNNAPLVLGDGSQKIIQQQARNTWQDWIWRGQVYKCQSVGVQRCDYQWSKAVATAYAWNIGGTLNLDELPVVGKYLPGSINGGFTKTKTLTTTFGWNVSLEPGYSAQPIQVVTRRWMRGVYKGVYVQTGGMCNGSTKWAISPRPDRTSMYRWDANRIGTSWQSNVAVNSYATYHVFK